MSRSLALVVPLLTAAFVSAESDITVSLTFVKLHKAEILQPAALSVRAELANRCDEPRWLVIQLLERSALPADATFPVRKNENLPLQCLKFEGKKGHAVLVHFQGDPGFDAILLPARGRVVFESLRLETTDADFAFWSASELLVNGKTTIAKWLPMEVASSAEAEIAEDARVVQLMLDPATGKVRADLPTEAVIRIDAKVTGKDTASVAGYEHPPVHYRAGKLLKKGEAEKYGPWRQAMTVEPAQNVKVEHLAFSPDGKRLLVSLQSLKLAGIDVATGKEIVFDAQRQGFCRLLGFDAQGQPWLRQFQGIADRTARGFYNVDTGKRVVLKAIEQWDMNWIRDTVFHPDLKTLAFSDDEDVYLWDVANDREAARMDRPVKARAAALDTLVFSPSGAMLAGAIVEKGKGRIFVWDVATKKLQCEFRSDPLGSTHVLAFAPNGNTLVVASRTFTALHLWDPVKNDRINDRLAAAPQLATLTAVTFSPDSRWLAVAWYSALPVAANGGVIVWDTATWKQTATLPAYRPTHGLAFSPDSGTLAVGDVEGNVTLWAFDPQASSGERGKNP